MSWEVADQGCVAEASRACSIRTEDSLNPPMSSATLLQKLLPSHWDGVWAPGSRTACWFHFLANAGAGPADYRKSCCYFGKVDGFFFFFPGSSECLTDGHGFVSCISMVASEALQWILAAPSGTAARVVPSVNI